MNSTYIDKKLNDLIVLMDAEPSRDYITVEQACDFLGMNPATFRSLATQGHIPFAIGGVLRRSNYTKIPKLTFYNWMMQNISMFSDLKGVKFGK